MAVKSEESADADVAADVDVVGDDAAGQSEACPACTPDAKAEGEEKEHWIRCDACKVWFHWRCVAAPEQALDAIDKWFCEPCRAASPRHKITLKPPARKSARKKAVRDYVNLAEPGAVAPVVAASTSAPSGSASDASKWARMLNTAAFAPDAFARMDGRDVCAQWLERDPDAMTAPVVIETPDGLGMDMPPASTTVADIAALLGADMPVEVIDVASQSGLAGWTLGKWAEYYGTPAAEREKVRNVISLEISGTRLAEQVLPPRLVRELDWVEKYWPAGKKGKGGVWPKVQLYCLMGTQDSWTDWHVDFAGSSVYYHILKGAKTFLFIRPTPANLAAYERWSGSELQTNTWLGDLVDEVMKVELTQGNTMIIPTGWIHAVYTPKDALVFGGNFLHSYNAATQLRVRDIEISTRVPKKFRFPYFVKLSWYVGEALLRALKAKEDFTPRVLESIDAIATFLVAQARTMERGSEAAKKEAKEQVPADKVKDAPALARELRWRVRLARGVDSDDEGGRMAASPAPSASRAGSSAKRKRPAADEGAGAGAGAGGAPFRNFQPKTWEAVAQRSAHGEEARFKARPEGELGAGSEWLEGVQAAAEGGARERVLVSSREVVTVKVRRTAGGVERHRVASVLETWRWDAV